MYLYHHIHFTTASGTIYLLRQHGTLREEPRYYLTRLNKQNDPDRRELKNLPGHIFGNVKVGEPFIFITRELNRHITTTPITTIGIYTYQNGGLEYTWTEAENRESYGK